MMASAHTEANRKLAALLGWTSIFEVGHSLMGTPPDGAPNSRGQALVPNWCGDWHEAGLLIGQFELCVAAMTKGASIGRVYLDYAQHGGRDATIRYLIVLAATARVQRQVAAGEAQP